MRRQKTADHKDTILEDKEYWEQFIDKRRMQLLNEFKKIDKNNDNTLEYGEVYNYLKRKTPNVDEKYLRGIFERIDVNADGSVSL